MKLREYNWDTMLHEEIEYPDEPMKSFIDFLRNTSAWKEDEQLVHRRYRMLHDQLNDIRNERRTMEAANGEMEVSFQPEAALDNSIAPTDWDA